MDHGNPDISLREVIMGSLRFAVSMCRIAVPVVAFPTIATFLVEPGL
ncbi:MAG: hypothetical protein IT514_08590 [Burkholderiales bacterium]|nr:hypothetical protein [Burkholderiales bacterium]